MVKNDRKATLQALHTTAVAKAVQCHERNVVLDGRPPPISNSEKELTRKERSTLAQLRSGYCRLLGSYKSRIKKDANLDVCADCGTTPHNVKASLRGERPILKCTWTERRTTTTLVPSAVLFFVLVPAFLVGMVLSGRHGVVWKPCCGLF